MAAPKISRRSLVNDPGMTRSRRPPALTLRTVVLIVAILVVGALGGWRPAAPGPTGPKKPTLVVGGATYTVLHAEQVQGLSDSDLGGMSHGVQSLVSADKALVVVTLVVAAGDLSRSFDPAVLHAFALGAPVGYTPVGGTLAAGKLRAHGRMEGSLSFIVPRKGAQLVLRAPGGARDVPLLRVDVAPLGADTSGHVHPSTSPRTAVPSPSHRP